MGLFSDSHDIDHAMAVTLGCSMSVYSYLLHKADVSAQQLHLGLYSIQRHFIEGHITDSRVSLTVLVFVQVNIFTSSSRQFEIFSK